VRDIGIRQATYQRFFFISLSLTASLATAFAYGSVASSVARRPGGGHGRGPDLY